MTTQNATPKTTTRRREARQMMLDYSIESGREVLANAAKMLASYAQELERYAVRYDDCGNDPNVKHEAILSWAVNHVACLQSNLRLDMFVTKAAEIAEYRTQLAAETNNHA